MSCSIVILICTCLSNRCSISLVSALYFSWYWSKSFMSCYNISLLYFNAFSLSCACSFKLPISLSIISWVIVTKNISFFCYNISTIVSFLPAKSLFFFLVCIISNAFSITFLSLELNVYWGTKLVSWGIFSLSNRFNSVLQEAVFFYHIFLSFCVSLTPYFYINI